jgi:hypothetical protein
MGIKGGIWRDMKGKDPEPSLFELIRSMLVGDCPFCGSHNTADGRSLGEEDPEKGFCLKCGSFWQLDHLEEET